MGRLFRIREGMNLELRAEFFDIFNLTECNNSDSTNALAPLLRNELGTARCPQMSGCGANMFGMDGAITCVFMNLCFV